MNNNQGDNKPTSLPSIKDLIEGGPGLIDYSPTASKIHSHRRHASEHILSNRYSNNNNNNNVIPPIPSSSNINTSTSSLPFDMQSLSLDKRKQPKNIYSSNDMTHNTNLMPSSSASTSSSRHRTHSRSFSDFTHPYPRQLNAESLIEEEIKNDSPKRGTSLSPLVVDDEVVVEEQPNHQYIIHEGYPTSVGGKYVCPYCEKGFTRPSSLRTHTYSHTGEKPFECTISGCGRKFSVQSNLRRHLRIHRTNKSNTLFITNNIK